MPYPRLLLPFSLLLLLGCRQSTETTPPAAPTDHVVQEDSVEEPAAPAATDTPMQAALTLDTTGLAPAPETPVKLLLEGTYHKNEVWGGAEKEDWLGVFRTAEGYELRPAVLHINTVKDPVLDSANVLSGREVVAADTNALFFVAGLRRATTGPVDTAAFHITTLPANKALTYTFDGREYTIEAYGDSVEQASGNYSYINYGWRVSGRKNGRQVTQTLVEDQRFKDSIYVLLWAGDLDRDGIPDLLLDLSNHYNISRYALYLSSMAERGKLYRKVAEFKAEGSRI